MSTPVDLQSVFIRHLPRFRQLHKLSSRQRQVCEHVMSCRTEKMGGAQLSCNNCEHKAMYYHACRDRHCPKCQRDVSRKWCEQQQAQVLPVTYHHLVFTLPSELNLWVERHPDVVYHLLFQCAWKTLKDFGADPRRLNGQMGMTAVLHTWGENLSRHVHLHCLVPGGALSVDDQWHAAKSDYLFPVRALSRGFRGRMVSALRQAERSGQFAYIGTEHEVDKVLDALMGKQWVVYSKPCPSKTKTVIDYLGRYSHRIAISDQRIVAMDEHSVQFSYKDYRENAERKQLTLNADEFIRRYLLHVLPKGLMRIRHYGFLGNRCRRKNLKTLSAAIERSDNQGEKAKSHRAEFKSEMCHSCPKCLVGRLVQGRPEKALPS